MWMQEMFIKRSNAAQNLFGKLEKLNVDWLQ